ncbi:SgcJ/EcaC family oxidoreductase [Microbispora sp. RL4-1S]|uniref:SgcJ/EcaC family oxidoreductase n=1 Tax=Microbispora oryzae TaxID=2806554 RepID=A0A941AKP3_9ACTN|nr:SgcJ/EcaC family oxidoreductase [Microbispora oryzae]MBP2705478.1 SgcJ/EcaC family oxidoreductase [Microbispora oryzae]
MDSDLSGRAGTGAGGSPVHADERAVLAVFDATSGAWADGDVNTFVRWYAEDASVILPGTYLRGKAEIRAQMGEAFALPLKGSKRVHQARSVRFVGADTAIVITRSATVFPGEAEPPAERWELATWVLSRGGDGWLVEAYHGCPARRSSPAGGVDQAPRAETQQLSGDFGAEGRGIVGRA